MMSVENLTKEELLSILAEAAAGKVAKKPSDTDELAKIEKYLNEGDKAYIDLIDIFNGAIASLDKIEFKHPLLRERVKQQVSDNLKAMLEQMHMKFAELLVRRSQILFESVSKMERLN
jgi:hypothetical protein